MEVHTPRPPVVLLNVQKAETVVLEAAALQVDLVVLMAQTEEAAAIMDREPGKELRLVLLATLPVNFFLVAAELVVPTMAVQAATAAALLAAQTEV